MDLPLSDQDIAFRNHVHAFLESDLPAHIADAVRKGGAKLMAE